MNQYPFYRGPFKWRELVITRSVRWSKFLRKLLLGRDWMESWCHMAMEMGWEVRRTIKEQFLLKEQLWKSCNELHVNPCAYINLRTNYHRSWGYSSFSILRLGSFDQPWTHQNQEVISWTNSSWGRCVKMWSRFVSGLCFPDACHLSIQMWPLAPSVSAFMNSIE